MTERIYLRVAAILIIAALGVGTARAAIGDNAPPIPGTYKTDHPRLPFPDKTFLESIAKNGRALAQYNSTADQWNSRKPGGSVLLRQLVIAYLVNKTANPARAAVYLSKIKALADLGGAWGPLLYAVNDGVGASGYTITSASANFLTGCAGRSCINNFLSIEARIYSIIRVPDEHTVIVSDSNPPISGTNLKIRILGDLSEADINIALIYDWLYNDLDPATRAEFMNELDVLCTEWEERYIGLRASPYNDVFYGRLGTFGLVGALAIYPDSQNGMKHLRFMTDLWFNVLMPVWKQVLGPEGGNWHESWPDYVAPPNGNGLTSFLVTSLLCWQNATGDPILQRESWVKNFAYSTMYLTRPDYILENLGDISRPYLVSDNVPLGSLSGLAEIYDDPILRGWSRLVNQIRVPDGVTPSAWPYYAPDKPGKRAADRSGLPTSRNFSGSGILSVRTGWTEDDTSLTLKYGDNFWSHEHFDAGSFTLFHRGLLALDSGVYRSGSLSKHENQYARQTIAHNTITVTDPADYYPAETFSTFDETGNEIKLAPPNDGGQRRIGTLFNQRFPQLASIDNIGGWLKNWDYYHTGTLLAYVATGRYTYAAVDITSAYNNKYSATTPNTTNRTFRVRRAIRHLLFIPRGTAAYVVVYDQVTSTKPEFVKRWLLHTVNKPLINGNHFEITRNEQVTSLPYVNLWPGAFAGILKHVTGAGAGLRYQYDGKLYGWAVEPRALTMRAIGGPGKEFWVEDPSKPGTGTNWNQCMANQCAANVEGTGPVENYITPDAGTAPHEPGSWRLEISPATAENEDWFLNVMLATTVEDTQIPPEVNSPANLPPDMAGATWAANGTTYTVMFPREGIGGHIHISGIADEDLLAHATPLPAKLSVRSGSGQAAAAGSRLPDPVVAHVADKDGRPVANAAVHFGVTAGNARISPDTAFTAADGTASVDVILGPGASGSRVQVMADVNGLQPISYTETVLAARDGAAVRYVSCFPDASSEPSFTCTVALSRPAAPGGSAVSLSSSSGALRVPSSVTVAPGSTSATFKATAGTASDKTSVTISATLNNTTQRTTLEVRASSAPAASPAQGHATADHEHRITTPPIMASGSDMGIAIQPGTWTMVRTGGFPPAVVGYENLVYASGVKKFIIWGDYHPITSEANEAMLAYDFRTNRWDVLGLNGNFHSEQLPEAGHPVGLLQYDPQLNVLISYCCHSGSQGYERPQHTWLFDPAGLTGRDVQTPTMPGLTSEASAVFNTADNVYMLFDREAGTWFYRPGSNSWTRMRPNGQSPSTAGYFAAMSYDSRTNKAYLFGGGMGNSRYNNDLYTYDFASNTWTRLSPVGPLPTPRECAGFAFDSLHNIFLMVSGRNASGVLTDTWSYNPTTNSWSELKPPASLSAATQPSYQRLAYDPDDNVFVLVWTGPGGYANGPSTGYSSAQTWLFRYAGSGTKCGSNAVRFSPPSGSINRHTDAWASEPALAGSGGDLFVAWTETGQPFENGEAYYSHVFASRLSPSGWTTLSKDFLALDSEFNGLNESHSPSIVVADNKPWMSWYKTSSSGQLVPNSLFAKRWTGASWQGGPAGAVDASSKFVIQSRSQLTAISGTPYVALLENDRKCYPWCQFVYVKQWNNAATRWDLLGTGPLNRAAASAGTSPLADSVSIASDGTHPVVAWTEYSENSSFQAVTRPVVYADIWNGGSWERLGGPLNVDSSGWAYDAAITVLNGQPCAAWVERDPAGAARLYVKIWTGSSWKLLGATPLNRDGKTGWAFRPAILADASALYIAWTEQPDFGKPCQTYVSEYRDGAWRSLGGSLNMNSEHGSAERVTLALFNGEPVASWGEVAYGSLRQIFVKRWNGQSWNLLQRSE